MGVLAELTPWQKDGHGRPVLENSFPPKTTFCYILRGYCLVTCRERRFRAARRFSAHRNGKMPLEQAFVPARERVKYPRGEFSASRERCIHRFRGFSAGREAIYD